MSSGESFRPAAKDLILDKLDDLLDLIWDMADHFGATNDEAHALVYEELGDAAADRYTEIAAEMDA